MAAPLTPSVADAPAAPPPSASITTNAVNRGISDLHMPTWLALMSLNITVRTALFHPLQLAIYRKRVTREEHPPSVRALLREAHATGKHAGGAASGYGVRERTAGIRGMYRGFGVALAANLIGEISYLWTIEAAKEWLTRGGRDRGDGDAEPHSFAVDVRVDAVSGMSGEVVALVLVTPLGVVCNRQATAGYGMSSHNAYRTATATFREVWQMYQTTTASAAGPTATGSGSHNARAQLARVRNGLRGLYAGASTGLAALPGGAVWWATYGKCKSLLYVTVEPTLREWELQRLARGAERHQRHDEAGEHDVAAAGPSADRKGAWAERLQLLDYGGGHPLADVVPRGGIDYRHHAIARGSASDQWLRQNWLLSPTDNPAINAVAGVTASVVTTVLFNPIGVIRTRLQTLPADIHLVSGASPSRAVPFARLRYIVVDLLRREGWRALFKGTTANIGSAMLDGLAFSILFELTKLWSDQQVWNVIASPGAPGEPTV